MKTNRVSKHFNELEIVGKLADLKDSHYKNTLMLTAVIELLVDKGIFERNEILAKAEQLESDLLNDLFQQFESGDPLKP